MRISVNLASRPFVEIRPLLARLRIAMAVLAVLALALGLWLHSLSARANAARARLDAVTAQTYAVQQQRVANEARMRQPQNRAILERSHFLNTIFARKSFSWTAVMMDLERVLPTGVVVTSIEPQVSKEGEVTIRLRVAGNRDRAVQLVRNLEHSARFVEPRLASETTQAADTAAARQVALQSGTPLAPAGVEFDILSGYNPLTETAQPGGVSSLARPTVTTAPATRQHTSNASHAAGQRNSRTSNTGASAGIPSSSATRQRGLTVPQGGRR